MGFLAVALVAAATFALCYGIDKGFTGIFRGKTQHKTGLSVRLNKRYGVIGILLMVLGAAAILSGLSQSKLLAWGGAFLVLVGACFTVYYMTFGLFYDRESFILTTFGKKSTTYRFGQIRGQQLYSASGNIAIELHLDDGRTVNLMADMEGVYPFLDAAFSGWCAQKGIEPEACTFHDPSNSCWFPGVQEES